MKKLENEKCTLQDLEDGDKTEKGKKLETHRIRPGIWQETLKKWKMRNTHCRTWIVLRKLKNEENLTHTLQDLEYGEKTDK